MKQFFAYIVGELRYVFSKYDFNLGDLVWDHAWRDDKVMFHNRFRVIAEIMRMECKPAVVVDIGAGDGELLNYLRRQNIITTASVGIDYSRTSVEKIKAFGFRALHKDITDPDFKLADAVDFIIMAEVVEHIRDIEGVLRNLKLAQARYGIVVTTPNLGYLSFRLRLLFGRFPYIRELPPREHIRFWTVTDFEIWARQLGFTVQKIRGCAGFPILYRVWPSLFAYDVLYLIR